MGYFSSFDKSCMCNTATSIKITEKRCLNFLFFLCKLFVNMNFEQLEKQVRKRKRGMITLENVYVVLLVAAWSSIVLLVM